jgi:hypothetical protein
LETKKPSGQVSNNNKSVASISDEKSALNAYNTAVSVSQINKQTGIKKKHESLLDFSNNINSSDLAIYNKLKNKIIEENKSSTFDVSVYSATEVISQQSFQVISSSCYLLDPKSEYNKTNACFSSHIIENEVKTKLI